ncbi:MAG: hypothetical protein AAF572_21940 [Cyanobacteria bacterium P01_B01_bin.77]
MDNDQESTPSKDFKNIAAILAKTNVSSLSEPSAYAAFAALPALAKILQGSASKSNGTQPGFLAAYENIQKMEADALANRLQKTVQKLDADISELKSQSGNILQREDIDLCVKVGTVAFLCCFSLALCEQRLVLQSLQGSCPICPVWSASHISYNLSMQHPREFLPVLMCLRNARLFSHNCRLIE